MKLDQWMSKPVQSIKPMDSIQHARETMDKYRINQLPVVVGNRLVGILTDRDLRDAFPSVFDTVPLRGRRPRPAGSDPGKILVESVMTSTVLSLTPDDSIVEAAQIMRRERIGAIPIVAHEQLVGILTRSDVLDAFVAVAAATPVPEETQPTPPSKPAGSGRPKARKSHRR